ncbi:MAG: enoyl-CoA hydratase [Gammaproteobacteria bacterium]
MNTANTAVLDADTDAAVLLREDRGGARILTLNRPRQRNALSDELIAVLHDALLDAGKDATVRAVIIAANGPVFCAGHDLREVRAKQNADEYRDLFSRCSEMMLAITRISKPVIAAVQGTATAAGCQLAASCDLAVAAEDAKFATPGVHIGLFCSTPMVPLSRNIGRKQAMQMLLLGEPLDAAAAKNAGLVNEIAPVSELLARSLHWAEMLAAKSPLTLSIGKEAFYRQLDMSLEDAYAYAGEVMVDNMMKQDAQEGIGAFIEKRPPVWQNK